ncbi:MAG: NADH-quinone oxidoreductase subunit C/D [Gammaproteobacteria bacterium]|nr:NADH-quinone oxidoreductase subunit C/D [Gammaproteobacteria bacterium]
MRSRLGPLRMQAQQTADDIPTLWVSADDAPLVLRYLKQEAAPAYPLLFDLTAIDECEREHRHAQPPADLTVVYHLLSFGRNSDVRVKVGLSEDASRLTSTTAIWPMANWYEREVHDMFGVDFSGHPWLRRILTPPTWVGHPLRKQHPARATEMGPLDLSEARQQREQEALRVDPEAWGLRTAGDEHDTLVLNLGPNHPSVHGVFRMVLQLDGETIVKAVPDIGYHHRGAEKMAERQNWHGYIPYTDRIDYLGGVMNNLPYVLAVERLAGIEAPPRAEVIRVMLCELFRIASHLVFLGTMAQDVGQISPVFLTFTDRERVFDIIEAICGFRMHPGWFRIGGVADDLPQGWDRLVREFLDHLPARLNEYERLVLRNRLFKRRTVDVGAYSTEEAIEWGVTGPGLRATGYAFDLRKARPYGGYEQFEFEVPVAEKGDCYDRTVVRLEEMRQSLRIVAQCLRHMPSGDYKARHPLTTPPPKARTLHDIETLITHFLNVSWGPVIPHGEACVAVEATKGINAYYLVSDGGTQSYRTRIRTPSFPHLQMIPLLAEGALLPDLIAILGSIDFVMADVDR